MIPDTPVEIMPYRLGSRKNKTKKEKNAMKKMKKLGGPQPSVMGI